MKSGRTITDTNIPATENVPKYIAESGIPASAAQNETHNVSQSFLLSRGNAVVSLPDIAGAAAPAPSVVTADSIRPASVQESGSKSVISSTASPTEVTQSLLR